MVFWHSLTWSTITGSTPKLIFLQQHVQKCSIPFRTLNLRGNLRTYSSIKTLHNTLCCWHHDNLHFHALFFNVNNLLGNVRNRTAPAWTILINCCILSCPSFRAILHVYGKISLSCPIRKHYLETSAKTLVAYMTTWLKMTDLGMAKT